VISVEKIIGHDLIVVVRRMRKRTPAVAVTQGPDAGHVGLKLIVNDDVAAVVAGNAGPFEAQILRVWSPSHCQKNMSTQYVWRTFVALDPDADAAAALGQGYTFRIQPNLYPLVIEDLAHGFRYIFVLTSNQARSHLYNRDFAPEPAIHLSEFQANVTSADDDEMLRQEVNIHYRGVGEKRNIMNSRHLRDRRTPADVDENLVGFEDFIVDHDSAGRLKASMALDDRAIL